MQNQDQPVYLTRLKLNRNIIGLFSTATIQELDKRGDAIAQRITTTLNHWTHKATEDDRFLLAENYTGYSTSVEAIAFIVRAFAWELAAKQTDPAAADAIKEGIYLSVDSFELEAGDTEGTALDKLSSQSFDHEVRLTLGRDIAALHWETTDAIAMGGQVASAEAHKSRLADCDRLLARLDICHKLGIPISSELHKTRDILAILHKELESIAKRKNQ